VAGLLRQNGFRVTLIDCLNAYSRRKEYCDGKFWKTHIPKPAPLKSIPRNYSRYGIPEGALLERFSLIEKPDVIGVTSGMTYWYPGLFETIQRAKDVFKGVPIVLGGIYATLCHDHAVRESGADFVFKGRGEVEILEVLSKLTDLRLRTPNDVLKNKDSPYPAFDLYPQLDYVCVSTSRGCPFRCPYCASPFLAKGFFRRDPLKVVEEIEHWTTRFCINNIAFYDDALLIEPSKHVLPILKEVIRRNIRCNFHAPNGLHIKEIDQEVADLLLRGGFKTIRLGFETSNEAIQIEMGRKVDNQEFGRAVKHLRRAGYPRQDIGAYIMVGLPGQKVEEVEESVAFVRETGARPILAEYSPIPHTPLFEKAFQVSPFDLRNEPLYHNNSILPCQWDGFTFADYTRVKEDLRRTQRNESI